MVCRSVIILWFGFLLIFSGCSIPFLGDKTSKAPIIEEIKRTPMNKILISELDILDRPYAIIGEVSVSEKSLIPFKSPDKEDATTKLREEAFKLHADAVIFVSYTSSEKSWAGTQSMEARGKAVKFTRY